MVKVASLNLIVDIDTLYMCIYIYTYLREFFGLI